MAQAIGVPSGLPAAGRSDDVRARIWLLGLILAIPLLGFGVSSAIRASYNSDLRAAAAKQVPDFDPAKLARFTVSRLCETNSGPEIAALCETDWYLGLLSRASVGSAAVGLGLLVVIALAGAAAQRNRTLLLTLFRPGLYVAAVTITGLIVVDAAIAIASIYYGESALINRIHPGLILGIAMGALLGVSAVARSAFGVVRKAEAYALGAAVTSDEAGPLWAHTNAVAARLGALAPDHIVVGLDPTFYVTEADVVTPGGTLSGRTLFCSLPLARILTVDEFTAIVGHELGHFRGDDTKFSGHFYPIYRGTATAIMSLQNSGAQGLGVVTLLPAIAIFGFFLERFALAESRHSRARELLADRAGAEATSPRAMASALVKVHAFTDLWNDVQRGSVEAMKAGTVCRNTSALFAEAVANKATPDVLDGLAGTHSSHPTDSHPPLAERLESLAIDLASVSGDALAVRPEPPAASLIPGSETREEGLSETYQRWLAGQLGIEVGRPGSEEPAVTDEAAGA